MSSDLSISPIKCLKDRLIYEPLPFHAIHVKTDIVSYICILVWFISLNDQGENVVY